MDSVAALPCASVLSPASYWTPCRSSLVGPQIAVSVAYDDESDYFLDTTGRLDSACVEADPQAFTCACCVSRPAKKPSPKLTIDEFHDDFSDAETLSPCPSPTSGSFHFGFDDDDHVDHEMQEQSPIDIRTDEIHCGALAEDGVLISSGKIDAELVHKGTNFSVCVKNDAAAHKNTLTIKGKTYTAVQFHFHTPSEHTFDGEHEAMEFHLVHQAEDGSLAVVAVFFRMGAENPFLAQFWDELLDLSPGVPTKIPLGEIDIRKLGIPSGHFLRYRGSLTTPPYSEGVEWVVVQDVAEASREQLDIFYNMLAAPNARPTQPLNKRFVRLGWGWAM